MYLTNVFRGIFLTILTSLYFFPFEFSFLPGVNTKMMMAAAGLVVLGIQLATQERKSEVNNDFFILSLFAAGVSVMGWFSIIVNNTPDTAYANYIVSMWVWLGGAYMLTQVMRQMHGVLSVILIVNYLVSVCVVQCLMALIIDSYPAVKDFVDSYVQQGQDYLNLNVVNRLYGIGASLDVAGSRFSAVLIMIAFVSAMIENTEFKKFIPLYLACFFFIAIVGNMIARTATVGLGLAVVCWLIIAFVPGIRERFSGNGCLWRWLLLIFAVAVVVSVFLYNVNPDVEKKIRFAFEGFFSLFESGEWEVSSNETLKSMYVFPETLKTWIIGDGYFSNPRDIDPYFIGEEIGGYYMGTDVGYLRFIFYFGVIGLFAMISVIFKAGQACIRNLSGYKLMFVLLLLANYVIWLKVSTDLFLVFALFLMVRSEDEEQYNKRISVKE